jgi:hypothetical protein
LLLFMLSLRRHHHRREILPAGRLRVFRLTEELFSPLALLHFSVAKKSTIP